MRLRLNEAKATQTAARILKLRGGQMHYIKLIKLLYLVDREALLRWGRPVTTARCVAMKNGPVLSEILDLIREEPEPGEGSIWHTYISSSPKDYEVVLLTDAPADELSKAEEDLIAEIFVKYGHRNRWDLVRFCHDLPEWQNPGLTSVPIEYSAILRAENKPSMEVAEIDAELQCLAAAEARYSLVLMP